MIKKMICIVLICTLPFALCGCWSYKGLNDLSIVAGIAIDKDETDGSYLLTCEIANLIGAKEGGATSLPLESKGSTILEAIRNAKKKHMDKLYFANTQIVIISSQVAGEDGIQPVIDILLRQNEPRNTINLVISQQETAKEILSHGEADKPPMSYEIFEIVTKDQSLTGSTRATKLYQAYNILKGQGQSLVLPSFHVTINNDKPLHEVNGIAVFKKDMLLGFLTPEESKYYLFAVGDISGGVLSYNVTENRQDFIALEIVESETKMSHKLVDDKIKMTIETSTKVILGEASWFVDISEKETMDKIKASGEAMLKKRITELIGKVQTTFNSDIFGFGASIYRSDPLLWNQLNQNWDAWFPTIEVEVIPEINIVSPGFLKSN